MLPTTRAHIHGLGEAPIEAFYPSPRTFQLKSELLSEYPGYAPDCILKKFPMVHIQHSKFATYAINSVPIT